LAEIVVKTEASETKHRCIRENLKTSQKSLASPVHWLLDMREKWRWPETRVAHFNRWQSEVLGRWECRKTACCADVTGTTGHCRNRRVNAKQSQRCDSPSLCSVWLPVRSDCRSHCNM